MISSNNIIEVFNYLKDKKTSLVYKNQNDKIIKDIELFQKNNLDHKVKMILIDGSIFVYAPALGGWAMMPPTGLTITKDILDMAKNIEIIFSDTIGM